MRRDDVKINDIIEVKACGLLIRARVCTVDFYNKDGWQIEMEDVAFPNTYRSWKQRHDGGRITKINGKDVPDVHCKDCVDGKDTYHPFTCRECSMYGNFKKPRVSSGMCPVHNRRCIYWYQNCQAEGEALRDCTVGPYGG